MKYSLLLELQMALGNDFKISSLATALIEEFGIKAKGYVEKDKDCFKKTCEGDDGNKIVEIYSGNGKQVIRLYERTWEKESRYLWYDAMSNIGFVNYPGRGVYLLSNNEIKYYDTEAYDLFKETTGKVEPTEEDFANLGIRPDEYRSESRFEDLIRIINGEDLHFDNEQEKDNERVSL